MVWNTYQCYLKAAQTTISSELAVVEAFGRSFGAKIVRGSYMEKERKLTIRITQCKGNLRDIFGPQKTLTSFTMKGIENLQSK